MILQTRYSVAHSSPFLYQILILDEATSALDSTYKTCICSPEITNIFLLIISTIGKTGTGSS
jgi:ABC-type iron transport system FetAB ATPase subunit